MLLIFHTYLWSIETSAKSNLCLLLNMTSFWGISSNDGGPKGVHIAKRARGGSSVFLFWPWSTFTLPRISNLCKNETLVQREKKHDRQTNENLLENQKCCPTDIGSEQWTTSRAVDNNRDAKPQPAKQLVFRPEGTNSTSIVSEALRDLPNAPTRTRTDAQYPTVKKDNI